MVSKKSYFSLSLMVAVSLGLVSAASAATLSAPVHIGLAKVSGHQEKVLTALDGHTLYYFTRDSADKATCTASCAAMWPPLQASGPIASHVQKIPGKFSSTKGVNGWQVNYEGHPLYTFQGDKIAGQANGNGIFGGTWWAVTPTVKSLSTASTQPAPHKSTSW
jgi:predicted lipoprotein with Yx(FWY)xxD motif